MTKLARYLTKSRFKSALECPSKLYYAGKDDYANNSEGDKFLSALAEGGYQVGELSKYYHSNGNEVISENYKSQLAETSELLQSEKVIIYEPAIKFKNYFIRVDIIVKDGDNVDLIEVKAKSFRSENEFYSSKGYISSSWRPYLYDVAFQVWVTESAFPDWNVTPFLLLADKNKKTSIDGLNQYFTVNEDLKRESALDVPISIAANSLGESLLTKVNVKKAVDMIRMGHDKDPNRKSIEENKDFISRAIQYSEYYEKGDKYPVSLGSKCKGCEFKNEDAVDLKSGYEECWNEVFPDFDSKAPHIFDIARFSKKKLDLLINRGLYRLDQIYNDQELINELNLNSRQIMQINKTVDDANDEYIDRKLYEELDEWIFPLHFIDFETSVVAIPFHKNRSPYEQIAFQFSCHTYHENGDIEHYEWIESEKGKFPNFDFVKNLKKVLDKDNGTILRYATHENTVLRQIRTQMIDESENKYKDLINWINTVTEWDDDRGDRVKGDRNMKDMLKLVKNHYYHKEMGGSNSIKSVLPSILTISDHIRKKYSKPLGYGNNLSEQVIWQMNDNTGKPHDPYKILPDTYQDLDLPKGKTLFKDAKVQDGSGALIAYGKLQFTEMLEKEKKALIHALKQYCELDTLAMVLIYEHWLSVKEDIC